MSKPHAIIRKRPQRTRYWNLTPPTLEEIEDLYQGENDNELCVRIQAQGFIAARRPK